MVWEYGDGVVSIVMVLGFARGKSADGFCLPSLLLC